MSLLCRLSKPGEIVHDQSVWMSAYLSACMAANCQTDCLLSLVSLAVCCLTGCLLSRVSLSGCLSDSLSYLLSVSLSVYCLPVKLLSARLPNVFLPLLFLPVCLLSPACQLSTWLSVCVKCQLACLLSRWLPTASWQSTVFLTVNCQPVCLLSPDILYVYYLPDYQLSGDYQMSLWLSTP